jgi:hypothetical protein
MQRVIMVVLVLMLLTVFVAAPVQAARQGPPQGTCQPGFEMHPFMDLWILVHIVIGDEL